MRRVQRLRAAYGERGAADPLEVAFDGIEGRSVRSTNGPRVRPGQPPPMEGAPHPPQRVGVSILSCPAQEPGLSLDRLGASLLSNKAQSLSQPLSATVRTPLHRGRRPWWSVLPFSHCGASGRSSRGGGALPASYAPFMRSICANSDQRLTSFSIFVRSGTLPLTSRSARVSPLPPSLRRFRLSYIARAAM